MNYEINKAVNQLQSPATDLSWIEINQKGLFMARKRF